jgi:nicotinic acid mononucleotide adenylyltransferase
MGHLVCAQEAWVQLELDRVLLVPVGVAPHKTVEADPGVQHRVAMCEAAVAVDERLGVSRADAERDGPSYTVDLLRALGGADELTFIVGGDMAHSLPMWRDPEGVLALARLGVAEARWLLDRPISNSGRLAAKIRDLAEQARWPWSVEVVFNPDAAILAAAAVALTSDSLILDGAAHWANLTAHLCASAQLCPWVIDLRA